MNGYDNLDSALQQKVDKYDKSKVGDRISLFFTWEDFCSVFINTTSIFYFSYKGVDYSVGKEGKKFLVVGNNETSIDAYESPEELLKNAKINGEKLSDIWNDLI